MELLTILLVLLIIGCLFPGSGHRYGPDIGEVLANLIAGVVVIGGIYFAWAYSVVGIILAMEWFKIDWGGFEVLVALLGPIAVPMLIIAALNARREVVI